MAYEHEPLRLIAHRMASTGQTKLAVLDSRTASPIGIIALEHLLAARGRVYEALGRTADAIADYRRMLATDPSMKSAKDGLRRLRALPSSAVALPR